MKIQFEEICFLSLINCASSFRINLFSSVNSWHLFPTSYIVYIINKKAHILTYVNVKHPKLIFVKGNQRNPQIISHEHERNIEIKVRGWALTVVECGSEKHFWAEYTCTVYVLELNVFFLFVCLFTLIILFKWFLPPNDPRYHQIICKKINISST